MRVVSPLLKHVIYPGLSRSGILRSRTIANPAVLTYHGVFPAGYKPIDKHIDGNLITAKQLRQQLTFLNTYYSVISPEDFLSWCCDGKTLPSNSILLTCDDGLHNNLTEMLPILQEFGMKCLFFVTGDSVRESGRMLWHEWLYLQLLAAPDPFDLRIDELDLSLQSVRHGQKLAVWQSLLNPLSALDAASRELMLGNIAQQFNASPPCMAEFCEHAHCSRFRTMNIEQLRQLYRSGMSIAAHTLSHPKLSQVSDELARMEMENCRTVLEGALGAEVWALAYPFGDIGSVTDREIQLAQDSGFTCGFLNTETASTSDLFALPRIHITGDVTCSELDARISGLHASLRRLLA